MLNIYFHLKPDNYTCDKIYGKIGKYFVDEFGFSEDLIVACGMIDSSVDAIGTNISYNEPIMVLSTSCTFITLLPEEKIKYYKEASSQAIRFVLPNKFSVKVRISAFWDVYAWLAKLLSYYPIKNGEDVELNSLIKILENDTINISLDEKIPISTDFFNGRGGPNINNKLRASIFGLDLNSNTAEI